MRFKSLFQIYSGTNLRMKFDRKLQSGLTLAIVFATISLSACSMRVMYNYLDWIIPWYMDDYVTLTDPQDTTFDQSTIQFLRWHRAEELPRYEEFVVSFKDAQTTPMSQRQVLLFFDDIWTLWDALITESMPYLLELSADLSEKQLQQINDALVSDNRKLQKKHGNRSEIQRRENWRNKMTDAVDDWLGAVTDEQGELIRLWSETRNNTTDDWLEYRDNWREKFMELLYNQQSIDYIDEMSTFLLNPQKMYSVSYHQAVTENRHHLAQFLADLSTTFTPRQRQHLQDKLTESVDDIRGLIG
jgi:hypothetical protein